MSLTKNIFLTCCLLLACCTSQKNEARLFYKFDAEDRLRVFRDLPIERQYQVYLFGFNKMHPPTLGLAEPIADKGLEAVPFLLTKLIETKNDNDAHAVAVIFGIMEVKNTFRLEGNFIANSIFKNRISRIEDNDLKQQCLSAASK